MRILIDIGHPAHVHYFRNLILSKKEKGFTFLVTARNTKIIADLLNHYNINYYTRHRGYSNLIMKLFNVITINLQLYKISKYFKPDLFLSFGSIYAAQIAFIFGKPHIALDDTEHSTEQFFLYAPFTETIMTPNSFNKNFGKKQLRFDSFMELSYLHPNYFQPNSNILKKLGVQLNERYVLIRLVSWKASHDRNESGFKYKKLLTMIKTIEKYAKVFISAESSIPLELKNYKINIKAHQIHDVLAYAALYIGEGATMASECAMLGTPAIYVNTLSAGTLQEQNKNGLLYVFNNTMSVIEKAEKILKDRNAKRKQINRSKDYLKNKVNVTEFISWFITHYPHSKMKLIKEPKYQRLFRNNID